LKKLLILLIIFVFGFSCAGIELIIPSQEDISLLNNELLDSPYISWNGRHLYKDNKEYFYNTATGFDVDFNGSSIIINIVLEGIHDDIYFSISKDNEDILNSEAMALSQSEALKIDFSTYSTHHLTILKRSEPQDGLTSISSIETNGTFLKAESVKRPHFLLLGASGISGHGALGSEGEPRTTQNSSSLHSFGFLTALVFGGSSEFVSNSGWGLISGYNPNSSINNIFNAYDYYGISSNQTLVGANYDNTIKKPDVVIINAGGNDYSAVINNLTGFDKLNKINEFKQAVLDLIIKIRSNASKALIIWTMTQGSLNGQAINSVIEQLSSDDKKLVKMVVIKDVGEAGPVGADNHCSYQTHQASSALLSLAIEQYTDLKRIN
jgi:hypothetical protein